MLSFRALSSSVFLHYCRKDDIEEYLDREKLFWVGGQKGEDLVEDTSINCARGMLGYEYNPSFHISPCLPPNISKPTFHSPPPSIRISIVMKRPTSSRD